MTGHRGGLGLSVDLDEWYHSRRWVEGGQDTATPNLTNLFRRIYSADRPIGEIVEPTRALLRLFKQYRCTVTFFALGEMAGWYPDLIREIADHGHEIACHGLHHVDATVLGQERFARELDAAMEILTPLAGQRPIGFRAPNLVYPPWLTKILESRGFLYDSTVHVSRPIGGKYQGWTHSPLQPYRPSYDDIGRPGRARLVEVPLPSFPVLRVAAGSSIFTRILGYHWTAVALRHAASRGTTMYYLHPWEVGPRPQPEGHVIRNRIFLRRTGPWMLKSLERILQEFDGRILTGRECAAPLLSQT